MRENGLIDRQPSAAPGLAGATPSRRWYKLATCWGVLLGGAVVAGGALEALGPPVIAAAHTTAVRPAGYRVEVAGQPGAAARPLRKPAAAPQKPVPPPSIDSLLATAEEQIAQHDGPVPLDGAAAKALEQAAAALPQASPEQRTHAHELAEVLFDRARTALQAGEVDKEQHWLALGAILAPPPDLRPSATELAEAARQDVTPKAAEANQDQAREADAGAKLPVPPVPPVPSAAPTGTKVAAGAPAPTETKVASAAPAPAPKDTKGAAAAPAAPPPAPPAPEQQLASATPTPNAAAAPATATAQTSFSIHFAAGSPKAEQSAQALAARFGPTFGGATTQSAPDGPRTAVIRYAGDGGHAAARQAARMVGSMGYRWRIERLGSSQSNDAATTVDVWIPGAKVAANDRPAAAPARAVARYDARPRRVWVPRGRRFVAYPRWRRFAFAPPWRRRFWVWLPPRF